MALIDHTACIGQSGPQWLVVMGAWCKTKWNEKYVWFMYFVNLKSFLWSIKCLNPLENKWYKTTFITSTLALILSTDRPDGLVLHDRGHHHWTVPLRVPPLLRAGKTWNEVTSMYFIRQNSCISDEMCNEKNICRRGGTSRPAAPSSSPSPSSPSSTTFPG